MPIHDLGYRGWAGERSSEALRWWVIAQAGVRLAWRSRWLRRMLFLAWLPALYLAVGFFAYERMLEQSPEAFRFATSFFQQFAEFRDLAAMLEQDPEAARSQVWATLLMILFRYPQGALMILMVGVIAPPLIAQDMRSRAFLIYFSRPLTPGEYVLGKAFVVWTYLFLIASLPALALYLLGVLLSPSFAVIGATWDLPLRILGASAVLMVPTTMLALWFSSMTDESRYAGFAWFAVWVLGWVAYMILTGLTMSEAVQRGVEPDVNSWTLLSLYHTLGRVQSWVFGLERSFSAVAAPALLLVGVTVVSLAVLLRRVSSPMRI